MATEVQILLVVKSRISVTKCLIGDPPLSSGVFLQMSIQICHSYILSYHCIVTQSLVTSFTETDKGGEGVSRTSTGTSTSQVPWSLLSVTL